MHDPSLDAARAYIRESVRALLDDLDLPPDAPGITDLTLDDAGVLALAVDPAAFDDDTLMRFSDQLRGIGLGTEGVEHVRVSASQTDSGRKISPDGVNCLVAVAGAKGGVGRTTITAALARILDDRGYNVGIFDCDVDTADMVTALAIDDPIHATTDGRPVPVSVDGIQVVSVELVAGDRPVVWRGAMVHDVLVDLLGRAAWDNRDIVLLDLPPGLGDAVYTTVQDVALEGAVVIQTPTPMGEAGATSAISLLETNEVQVLAEVHNMVTVPEARAGSVDETVEIPVDSALQTDPLGIDNLTDATSDALTHLASLLIDSLQLQSEPAEAPLDLRGLPTDLVDRQAILEVADAPNGPADLLVDHPHELAAILDESFDANVTEVVITAEGETVVRPMTANPRQG